MTNNNTSAEERYLKKLTNNVVTPGLFSKRNSKTDRGTQLPEGSTASSDTMRTPKRTVNRSPRGFRWSIEHMSVMYPADIDESAQSTICPFGDANNADVQRALDVYWEGVHNVMSPDERKRSQSTASRGYESDVASLPRTPKQNGNMATPKRSVSHVPQSSSLRTRCTFPRSSLSTPQSSSRSFEEMSADSPSNIDENSASPYCSFEDTDGDTVPHEIDQYWERSHYAMSPRVRFMPSPGLSPIKPDEN